MVQNQVAQVLVAGIVVVVDWQKKKHLFHKQKALLEQKKSS